jgi:hypothetical protein
METELISKRYALLAPWLDERRLRLYVAAEALALGYGGTALVSQATGVSRPTITVGCKALLAAGQRQPLPAAAGRIRNPGGGRKRTVEADATLRADLESLIDPVTRGDPEAPLRWTSQSVRKLADELNRMGHQTSQRMVAALLQEMGYSLQANRKTLEGSSPPDRDAQFEHIHQQVKALQTSAPPVISVDTKKKARVGAFKNLGRELRPKGDPVRVRVHDFELPELGKVAPYGVYDQTQNMGWVNVGTDHDTAAFAVASIRRWWNTMGPQVYPNAQRLLITADSGGSHGDRTRLWKTELQTVAQATGLEISVRPGLELSVRHLPPGTSKWNKIEHRLFSYISQNWRGKPLVSHEVIVNLIASTTPGTGLTVRCELDTTTYPKGIRITDQELKQVHIIRDPCHGAWNYTIKPHSA